MNGLGPRFANFNRECATERILRSVGDLAKMARFICIDDSPCCKKLSVGLFFEAKMSSVLAHIDNESSTELWLVFGAVFVVTYLLYRRQNVSHSGHNLPPAMPSLPIVGSLPFLPTTVKDLAELCISPRNKLGKIFSLRIASK